MAELQINPSTNEVYYNTNTKKVIVTAFPCMYCSPKSTPEFIQFTVTGIKYCFGFGTCCPEQSKYKFMGEGIGWNGTMTLKQQGNFYPIWVGPGPYNIEIVGNFDACSWSGIELGDFGQLYEYADGDCSGGVIKAWNIIAKRYRVINWGGGTVAIEVHLYFQLSSGGDNIWADEIFTKDYSAGYPWDDCVPYGREINNLYTCPDYMNDRCVGDGMVILTVPES